MHGKKIPYARTKRNNKQQKSTYKKRTFTLGNVKSLERKFYKTLLKSIIDELNRWRTILF